jgi:hypothetical protein
MEVGPVISSLKVVFVEGQTQLPLKRMILHGVRAHELPEHLGRGQVLRPARLYKGVTKVSVNADTEADIFFQHAELYHVDTHLCIHAGGRILLAPYWLEEEMTLLQDPVIPPASDQALIQVGYFLTSKPDLLGVLGRAIRKSFDEVIDAPRTGRYRVEQLEKTEKTYIGTKVEIVLRTELGLERGKRLDNLILGHEVDTKFTIGSTWMIPREAIGELCLLVTGDDNTGSCAMGILRMEPTVLTNGANQDGKKSVSALGKAQITWLARGPMPRNFMLDLPAAARDEIMSAPNGVQAIRALFRNATGRLIPRSVIEQVAQQKDYGRRAREAKDVLAAEGIQVLCAKYEREQIARHGFSEFNNDDWLSMPLG